MKQPLVKWSRSAVIRVALAVALFVASVVLAFRALSLLSGVVSGDIAYESSTSEAWEAAGVAAGFLLLAAITWLAGMALVRKYDQLA